MAECPCPREFPDFFENVRGETSAVVSNQVAQRFVSIA